MLHEDEWKLGHQMSVGPIDRQYLEVLKVAFPSSKGKINF